MLRIQAETFPHELSDEEIERWEQALKVYPTAAIEYAFDQHWRLEMFFPVPTQIIDLCRTWQRPSDLARAGCDDECKARHGKGYSGNDCLILWKLFLKRYPERPDRRLTRQDHDSLLAELDQVKAQHAAAAAGDVFTEV